MHALCLITVKPGKVDSVVEILKKNVGGKTSNDSYWKGRYQCNFARKY
uniref:Uncharacterized protein n=1 Tax=uncultured marine thaumarchaeote KM3_05_H05 TaxID=1455972 RepID=A0A075G340_9ARCH|nr:hypothetical protein [uncultured marine thaumarchaeote KM3_05_H05]